MRNKLVLFLMLLTIAFVIISSFAARFSKATQVSMYKPTSIPTAQKVGYCWTNAISVVRPDAWRCMLENEILDPCFSTSKPDLVVCGVGSENNQEAFALKLTKPLPKAENIPVIGENTWMMQLEDGSICRPFTGTMPIIPEKDGVIAIKYGCSNKGQEQNTLAFGVLDGSVKTGKLWTAKQVTYRDTPNGVKIESIRQVNILKVWQ